MCGGCRTDLQTKSGKNRNTISHRSLMAVVCRVYKTGGNRSGLTGYRSNRSGPVPVWADTKPVQIQNSNLNSIK